MEGKKKQACFMLEFKLKLIDEVERGAARSEICRRYGLAKSTLATFISQKDKIRRNVETAQFQPQRKRMRCANNDDLETALLEWFKQMRAPISGPVLCMKAQEFAREMGLEQFTVSSGWLERFKQRKGIAQKQICGESASVSQELVTDWASSVLSSILGEYSPEDIYNADETGLFYRCLPDKTLAFKGEICSGGKLSKERLTVLVAANMSGTDKLPLLIIGKCLHPRCFKNVKRLPVEYNANKKAWMTSVIFEQWVRNLDRKMNSRARQIALFVDNCPAHPRMENLKAIKLVFLHPTPPLCFSLVTKASYKI